MMPLLSGIQQGLGGDVGLITVEATHVATVLFPIRGVTRMLRADDDCYNPGIFVLAEAVYDAIADGFVIVYHL